MQYQVMNSRNSWALQWNPVAANVLTACGVIRFFVPGFQYVRGSTEGIPLEAEYCVPCANEHRLVSALVAAAKPSYFVTQTFRGSPHAFLARARTSHHVAVVFRLPRRLGCRFPADLPNER